MVKSYPNSGMPKNQRKPILVLNREPKTIKEVIAQLDQVIEDTIEDNNYLGIFAYVYRRTTAAIEQAIKEKRFEENERMERFDVQFANYYLNAYKNFKKGKPVSKAWQISFDHRTTSLTIMQHLMLGMNAHINLDLGATAGLFKEGNIEDLESDFMRVNDILKELTDEMQLKVSRSSFLIAVLDKLAKKRDEEVANFSIVQARKQAWRFACNLAEMDTAQSTTAIAEADQLVASIGRIIINPKSRLARLIIKIINWLEEKNVKLIIQQLQQ